MLELGMRRSIKKAPKWKVQLWNYHRVIKSGNWKSSINDGVWFFLRDNPLYMDDFPFITFPTKRTIWEVKGPNLWLSNSPGDHTQMAPARLCREVQSPRSGFVGVPQRWLRGNVSCKGTRCPPSYVTWCFFPILWLYPLLQIRLWYDIPPKLCWFSFTPWIQKRSLYPPLTATSRQQWSHWDAIPKWLKLDTLSDEKSLIWIVIDHILWWLEWLQYV